MSALITAVALTAVGTAFSAYSSYQQGQAAGRLNDYNAKLAELNAQVAQRDGALQANVVRQQNQRLMARQRAAFAANGVVGETGSPLIVEAQQAGYLEMGALETERQGTLQAGRYYQQSVLDRMQGGAARLAGNLNAGATILQGAGRAVSGYSGIG